MVLNWWNHNVFKNLFHNILLAEERVNYLEECCQADPSVAILALLMEAKGDLGMLQTQEEIFWKQKVASKNLMEGDKNTKYFHALVNKKRAINDIHKITKDDGSISVDHEEIASLAVNFFHKYFNKNFSPFTVFNHAFIPKLVSNVDNAVLTALPLMDEIKDTLFNMNGDSVAGSDGFTTKFFQHSWNIIAEDFYVAVLDFFKGSPIPNFFSSTSVVLIPKSNEVNSWNEFRHISLCSVFYKLVSKILMNRLSLILPNIISPNQMGFVKGRAITDNILLAQEMKLDIAKAYNNINWNFIYSMLNMFGFDDHFISLIKVCIENPHFSIIVNGKSHGYFKASHGLRQGDPISPALFIIAAEFLSRGLSDLFSNNPNLYFKILGGFNISHFCFADDFIVFANASTNNIKKIMCFFKSFEEVSGLVFNKQKSCFATAKSVNPNRILAIKNLTGFSQVSFPLKYLGIPLYKGRKKALLFDGLVSSVMNKLASWDSNFLSFGGRLVLIKNVLNSLPVYCFQTLFPPKFIYLRLERIFNKFFWRGNVQNSKIHWSSWVNCCGSLQEGAFGCKSMADMVNAFSFKLWFNFRNNVSFWAKFMRAKYCGGVLSLHVFLL
ncbi:Putative ribonuclease H protein [Dendrobium catenatum]|uniref:Ribonuclease H protein n=1 Tax=Dendrobium catenatum TaxID=906689 RepID=A0A2I0WX58_9ASPA|nr:Putative ribonuclease H protein [Dendrobium catenatum]